jgi:hypothetical protein
MYKRLRELLRVALFGAQAALHYAYMDNTSGDPQLSIHLGSPTLLL